MNSGLAIASITAVLKNLLEDGLVQNTALSSMGNILVTTLPPDQISVGVDGQPQLNLFMYQVSQNRNADWTGQNNRQSNTGHFNHAGRDALGGEISPLAINLHYLITVYGTQDFQTEILLGCVMQLMHQSPVLSNDAIRSSLKHAAMMNRTGPFAQAITSNSFNALIEKLGQVQIEPDLFDTEQMSRLWSLLRGSYRPSVTYQVSMVSIASDIADSSVAIASREKVPNDREYPIIEKVIASPTTNGVIVPGCDLILYGKHLRGDITKIRLNDEELTPTVVEDIRLLLKLPSTLSAGTHQIQVVHKEVTNPLSDGAVSDRATFSLRPSIKASAQTAISEDQEQLERTTVTVQFNLKIAAAQQVVLKFMAVDDDAGKIFTVSAPSRYAETDIVTALIKEIPSGQYLVQAQVDGIDSFLDMNQREHRVMIQTQTVAPSSGDEEMSETEYQVTALIEGDSETEEEALGAQPRNENPEIENHHEYSLRNSNSETELVNTSMSGVGNLGN